MSSLRVQWNDEEDRALDYLPHVDQIVYLRGIRRRMDYATGVAGMSAEAPISYAWLSQLCEVRPVACSTMRPPPRLKKDELRSIFKRLERAGLIEWVRDHGLKTLVFRCLLADRGQSARNMSHPSATHQPPIRNHPERASENSDLSRISHPSATHAATAKSHPIQESGIPDLGESYDSVEFAVANLDGERQPGRAQGKPPRTETGATLPVASVFEYWRTATNHPRARLDEKRRKAIAARLKDGYRVEDLKRAVDGCLASPWHQGANNGKRTYDDIELICRNASKVDQFLSIAGAGDAERRKLDEWLNADQVIEGECRRV